MILGDFGIFLAIIFNIWQYFFLLFCFIFGIFPQKSRLKDPLVVNGARFSKTYEKKELLITQRDLG